MFYNTKLDFIIVYLFLPQGIYNSIILWQDITIQLYHREECRFASFQRCSLTCLPSFTTVPGRKWVEGLPSILAGYIFNCTRREM